VALVHAAVVQVDGRDRRAEGREVEGGRNPKDAKVMLAKEITARFHSAAAADAAEQDFINRSKGGVPDEIPEVSLAGAPLGIGALLKRPGWRRRPARQPADRRRRRAHRLAGGQRQGPEAGAGTYVVQVGKRKFARVTLA
jgi:tyrosyl-tRNA synthetase